MLLEVSVLLEGFRCVVLADLLEIDLPLRDDCEQWSSVTGRRSWKHDTVEVLDCKPRSMTS